MTKNSFGFVPSTLLAGLVFLAAMTGLAQSAEPTGGPIDPEIGIAPASFSFLVGAGDADSDQLTIENIGGGTLIWDIALEDATSALRGTTHDPLLDETLVFTNFTVISPANGGTPEVQVLPAGVLTSGLVVGFSFEGTVAGISGNGDWASDMCMQIEGPDGSSYSVGGIGAAIPNCNVNLWDFNGGGSTDDGTYSSQHLGVWPFPPGAGDDGDWTFTFIHGWNSTSSNPMDWSNVTVTLHKVAPPEPCDNPGLVSWLSVDPASGSTEPGAPSVVDIMVDSDGLSAGTYNANVCINSNDSVGNELVVVPVELNVVLVPEIEVSPASLAASAISGQSTDLTLSIANLGTAELLWDIDQALAASPRAHFPSREYLPTFGSGSAAEFGAEPLDAELLAKHADTIAADGWQRGLADPVPAFTTTGFSRSDYVSLDALQPGALTSILDPGAGTIFAQTFIENDFSQHFFIATGGAALAQNAYGFVDTTTGAVNQLGVLTGVPAAGTWVSVAWDPVSGAVYGLIVPAGGDNRLFEIDVDTGVGTLVGNVSGLAAGGIVIGIAIDSSGLMYGLEIIDDVLVAIDKTDAVGAIIGPVGFNANFAQDMDFDRSTDTLYWASYLGGGNSNIRIIDTSTGATTLVGPIQDGAELLSFSVAVAGAGGCDAPENVPWLSLDSDAGSIQPGDPVEEVQVTLDAGSLTEGIYNALLCINSNDPDFPLIEVPVEFEVLPIPDADLSLSMTVLPAMVQAGEAISLEATIANNGPAAAEAVSLEVSLPAEISFVSGSLDQGAGTWNCAEAAGLVTCELTAGSLPVDAQVAVLLIEVEVALSAAPGNYSLDGQVISGNDTDPDLGNNTASAVVEVVPFTVTTIVAAGQGTITPASQAVASGAAADFTVTPDTGWSISTVVGDSCAPSLLAGDQWQAAGIEADCAVEASFVINSYNIGGSVDGLTAAGLELDLNGTETLPVAAGATSFEFVNPLPHGSNYEVTVATQPAGQWCVVSNGQGEVNGEPVTDVLVGCGNVGISFSHSEIDFGTVTTGSSSSLVLTISNPGSNPLTIDGIIPPGNPFEIIADNCSPLPQTLEAGESCSLEIQFSSQDPGLHTDQLIVSSNAANSPHTIPISGNGILAIPVPFLSPFGLLLLMLVVLVLGFRYTRGRQRMV